MLTEFSPAGRGSARLQRCRRVFNPPCRLHSPNRSCYLADRWPRAPAAESFFAEKEVDLLAFDAAALPRLRYERAVVVTILVIVGVRLVCAAVLPLSFDETDYWIWSKHIAGGYLDHPPVNPILIRIGTTLFGDSEFGVRAVGVLLALAASWAVWRSAEILFKDRRTGATAALYFNLTLVMAAGSLLATPDNPVVIATAFLLLTLCKLLQSGRGTWWLVIGVAFGVGMLAKYTTIFFAVGILAWLLLVPELRRWLFTPWPWIAALLALGVFSPTLIWNAQHDWASVHYQFQRLVVHEWSLRYLGELLLTQIGMATPPIFVLGCMGLAAFLRGEGGSLTARVLINAMVWPIAIYFAWHSLHGRVEGNWPEPVFVPFVIAAAAAAERIKWQGVWAAVESWSRRLALPLGLVIAACLYVQAVFGVIPLGGVDPTAQNLGAGWRELAVRLDGLRTQLGAPVVMTTNQRLTGWLSFYLPSHPPVVQINNRIRWVDAPAPDPALFAGPIMYVCVYECSDIALLHQRFEKAQLVTNLTRTRRGVPIEEYSVYQLARPIGSPLDPPDIAHFR
jgi:4-amino-4-deoxy-L-arabinose transferase-like glycosyltransferase